MAREIVAAEVRCDYERATDLGTNTYRCRLCECWTANLPLYKDTSVCEKKDRRRGGKGVGRRRDDR